MRRHRRALIQLLTGLVGGLALVASAGWLCFPLRDEPVRAAASPRVVSSRRPDVLKVRCSLPARPIHPGIYGFAAGDYVHESARRIGGNPMTRLNFELGDTWNAGSDWFFENVRGDSALDDWLEDGLSRGLSMALTVPMIGWVAKDGSSFSFPVSVFGPQQHTDPNRPDAGNGLRGDGEPIAPGPASRTSIAAPPEKIGAWIRALRAADRARGVRRVHMYILDNEPDLWHVTHRDVHPEPLSYDELIERTIAYATQIRAADPDALIAGPASWGYVGYFDSPRDTTSRLGLRLDRRRHGGLPLLAYYLQALAAHERRTGTRLLDVLDVHFYPQADGVYANSRTDAATAALRLRSTRALWDPSYVDDSWIEAPIQLIPRLRQWVERYYPGRALSLGEWSFGAEDHISGALATAEALGRFGQHELDWAFYWRGPRSGSFTFEAFRAFRDFDGAGARFLDWSVPTQATERISLFASRNAESRTLVLVLIQRDATHRAEMSLDLSECGEVLAARRFVLRSNVPRLEAADASMLRGRTLPLDLSPLSLEVLELTL
ncbi:MAG TPA: glycoside hydrolase family 44 protein [Polyangiaceae bacterium]|nr:glycoside hydrolase family 44 protein [Polyangiaceae bacterium]